MIWIAKCYWINNVPGYVLRQGTSQSEWTFSRVCRSNGPRMHVFLFLKKHKHHQMQAKHLMTSSWYQLLIFAIRGWYCTRKYKSMKGTNRIRNLCNIKWKNEANPIPCLKNIKQISSRWNKDSFVFPILPFSMAFTFDQIRVS